MAKRQIDDFAFSIAQHVELDGAAGGKAADAEAQYATATLNDIRQLVEQLRLRDERMSIAEAEMRKITEEYRRLREDLLPVFRMAKEGQPLPYHPNAPSNQNIAFEA